MKFKYLLIPFLALAVGCTAEDPVTPSFKEFSIEPSYLSLKAEGGSVTAEIQATENWAFEPNEKVAEWLDISPVSGAAGNTSVKFTAKKAVENEQLSGELRIKVGEKIQFVKIIQGEDKLVITPIAEVRKAADGKVFAIQGVLTNLTNTLYGNFDIVDKNGDALYIYGILDKKGAEKNFLSLGIDEGDEIIVKGAKGTYSGSPQIAKAVLIKIVKKSLLKVKGNSFELEKDDSELVIEATLKENNLKSKVCFGEGDETWLTMSGISKKDKDPNNKDYEISFAVKPYTGFAPRKATIELSVGDNSSKVSVLQYGNTPEPMPVAEAIKQPMKTWLSVQGTVVGVHDKGVAVSDGNHVIYAYVNGKPTVKFGHKVLVSGGLGAYSKFFQITTPVIRDLGKGEVTHPSAKPANKALIDSYLAGGDRTAEYVTFTGVPSGKYGEIELEDGYLAAPYYISSRFNYPKDYEGKKVTIRGYVLQAKTKDKNHTKPFINVLVTDVNEVK